MIVVETLAHCEMYYALLDQLPEVKAVIAWDVKEFPPHLRSDSRFYRFDNFLGFGNNVTDQQLDAIEAKARPGQCCALVYTGGATGQPKAVMLSHDNLLSNMIV